MGTYLSLFHSIIRQKQATQILNLLNKKKNAGQITSITEFSKRMEDLMRELTSAQLIPSLKIYKAEENSLIDAEAHNFMLERVQDDLEALFIEAIRIDEVLSSHETIARDLTFKNIRAGVSELETKIDFYESISKNGHGFDSGIFSSFREINHVKTINSPITTHFFHDPRDPTIELKDAVVELIGDRLVLPYSSPLSHVIKGIRLIYDDEAPQSEIDSEIDNNKTDCLTVRDSNQTIISDVLENLIDTSTRTVWRKEFLFKQSRSSMKLKMEIELDGAKEINFIQIDPLNNLSIQLEEILYLDRNSVWQQIEIETINLCSPTKIQLAKIFSHKLCLIFSNQNQYSRTFEFEKIDTKLGTQSIEERTREAIGVYKRPYQYNRSRVITEPITEQFLQYVPKTSELIVPIKKEKELFNGYGFSFGFNSITIGYQLYKNEGVYVSAPLEVQDAGIVGLNIIESRPYLPADSNTTSYTQETYDHDIENELDLEASPPVGRRFLGSIEYYIAKVDEVLGRKKTIIVPIMPMGTDRIHQERLIIFKEENTNNYIGKTLFFTTLDAGNIKVYEDNRLLTRGIVGIGDWDNYPVYGDTMPNSSVPMQFNIKIHSPMPGAIYTVSYNPAVSTTLSAAYPLSDYIDSDGIKIVDMIGDLSARIIERKRIIFSREDIKEETILSTLYLIIVLRQNSADQSLSPAIEEYHLLTGYKDPTKFDED